jgi:hypothetical protein
VGDGLADRASAEQHYFEGGRRASRRVPRVVE